MADSTDHIVSLARKWGAEPDKLYGISCKEHQQASAYPGINKWLRLLVRSFRTSSASGFRVANPVKDRIVLAIAEEIASTLEIEPFEHIFVDTGMLIPRIFVDYERWSLTITESLLDLFTRDELRALIGHELHHFRQPLDYTSFDKVAVLSANNLVCWMKKYHIPGQQAATDQVNSYLEKRAVIAKNREFEADGIGAKLVSSDVMAKALIKLFAYIYSLDNYGFTDAQLVELIDQCYDDSIKYRSSVDILSHGTYRFSERIAKLGAEGLQR